VPAHTANQEYQLANGHPDTAVVNPQFVLNIVKAGEGIRLFVNDDGRAEVAAVRREIRWVDPSLDGETPAKVQRAAITDGYRSIPGELKCAANVTGGGYCVVDESAVVAADDVVCVTLTGPVGGETGGCRGAARRRRRSRTTRTDLGYHRSSRRREWAGQRIYLGIVDGTGEATNLSAPG